MSEMKRIVKMAKSEWVVISAILFLVVLWAIAFEYVFDTAAPTLIEKQPLRP
jgi:hypothetical protein